MQRGQRLRQIGWRTLLEYDPFNIKIQHGAQDRRIVVHGQNDNRQARKMTLDVLDQGDPIAVFISRHGEVSDQHMRI
ncbi:Uncharacterised protein [Salmonella enterica subsp. enterica serovar Bovismorbificans]|uniref:Uncharacterized protein n=1 Tax=Salmonella enterica subsp. enterica serovar Bovismorbificans TaxID=58097 RepID=A0A655E9I4_SALET|nr:Uncharacterised protein [Salmonella enterica subsp. enterica serovar Bovismorbificans]